MEQKRYGEVILEGISVPVGTPEGDVLSKARHLLAVKLRAKGSEGRWTYTLFKKSVDARKREDIRLVYSVLATSEEGSRGYTEEQLTRAGVKPLPREKMTLTRGTTPMNARPLVVGMGPAGLFCAYLLAREGYAPILIDRGDSVADRVKAVDAFYTQGKLDAESNIQFGAGGAGTFSDGKLLTRISDPRCTLVLETLRRMGAPDDITLKAKPHVGTDVLRVVVQRMLDEIRSLGGEVIYRCRMERYEALPDGTFSVTTSKGSIHCGVLVLAIGHSARDTFRTLHAMGVPMEPKAFSIGARIEHPQSMIDRSQYGSAAGHPALGAAEYKVNVTLPSGRGVYTFCMCPGGQVVAAASADETVVTNGMSLHARAGENANAALLVGITPADFGSNDPLAGVAFQEKWEHAAFIAGGSNAHAPAQKVGDLLADRPSTACGKVRPSYRPGVKWTTLRDCLPEFAYDSLREAIPQLDRRIKGFADPDAVLTGVETRSSSPVRILRDSLGQSALRGLYPTGEGAGYAGGITSAAVDGIRAAEHVATGE